MARASASGGPDFSRESALLAEGLVRVCGVDEAGRGPLVGPVVAAAVILNPESIPAGLDDSKKLTSQKRQTLIEKINHSGAIHAVSVVSAQEIDRINIRQATLLAMTQAVNGLVHRAEYVLIDGRDYPPALDVPCEAVIKGDAKIVSIAAASIIAKETRDAIMKDLDQHFPGYGWAHNSGYPTRQHIEALNTLGVTPHHRRSYAPVKKILAQTRTVQARQSGD
ncbi:MAG: ribonuclease HII [Magnetococcales bacterium]|nr:ribonuclease HII [Magnetococcales bacterium]